MMPTTQAMYDALRQSLAEIENQIEAIKHDIASQTWIDLNAGQVKARDPYRAKASDGRYLLEPLLIAKASTIASMAQLKSADLISKTPTSRR